MTYFENGNSFLYITGTCEAWVLPSAIDEFAITYHSTLSADVIASVADLLRWSTWRDHRGVWMGSGQTYDNPLYKFRYYESDANVVVCGDLCDDAGTPEAIRAAAANYQAALDTVRAVSSPLDGPVRVYAFANYTTSFEIEWYDWPLEEGQLRDLAHVQDDLGVPPGSTTLFEGEAASALRTVRARWLAGPRYALRGIPVRLRDDSRFVVFVRDAMSIEDAIGLVD